MSLRTRTRRRGAVVAVPALLRSSVPDALSVAGAVDIGALIELPGAVLGAGVAVAGAALLAAAEESRIIDDDESRIVAIESAGAAELVRSVVVSRASGSLVVVGLVVGDGLDGKPGVPVRTESFGDGCVVGVPGDVVGEVGEVVGDVGDVGEVGVWADAAAAPNVSASAAPRLSERLRIGRIS